jgi:hypothetical protein
MTPKELRKIRSKKLNKAVDSFVLAMKSRLAEKERQNWSGWDGKGDNAVNSLDLISAIRTDLNYAEGWHDVKQAQMLAIDIANRCMMLWFQQNEEKEQ